MFMVLALLLLSVSKFSFMFIINYVVFMYEPYVNSGYRGEEYSSLNPCFPHKYQKAILNDS